MLPQSHAQFGGSHDVAAMQPSLCAPRPVSSTPGAGSNETRKAGTEAACVKATDGRVRTVILPAKCSSQETPIGPARLPGVVPSKPLSPLDGVRELQHDASCNSSLAHTEGEKDSPGEYCLGLKQLALQSVLLFVSWVSLALLHPNGCPLLLLFAIILSRLHLGWLLCCVLRMLLPRCR